MTIYPVSYKIDLSLMKDIQCNICAETAIEKIAKRIFPKKTEEPNYDLCFYGHMAEGVTTKSIIPHILCEDCVQKVIEQAATQDVFRRCFSCNKIPSKDWREKYSWDKYSHEFRRELKPLAPKTDQELEDRKVLEERVTMLFSSLALLTFIVPSSTVAQSKITYVVVGVITGILAMTALTSYVAYKVLIRDLSG